MNLYKISQKIHQGYETFDSAVVAAETETKASLIHPGSHAGYDAWEGWLARTIDGWDDTPSNWSKPADVMVEYIDEAKLGTPSGVIVASFNAG